MRINLVSILLQPPSCIVIQLVSESARFPLPDLAQLSVLILSCDVAAVRSTRERLI